ncbi:uncharacterized protein A4U43_C03F15340 [Asparagus officinalis]|uniref:DUF6821 domain-containing protein n=1 Tax=Asparagus officinalis TaxID=4686 RepID=A0A5P1FAU0_ASPOF|nr:uncharacterized protein LOC109833756 isoform X2 [Asparagus officinalis]ONK75292.1 uncharacterized protein A4U43_C03F15340 [Asparagus officinalis]
MEKSSEMSFEDWELIPNTSHGSIEFDLGVEKGSLIPEDIDIYYFSNDKKIEEKQDYKDIGVVPDHRDVEPAASKKLEGDEFDSTEAEQAAAEPEQMLFDSEEEEEFYRGEKSSEKEVEYVEPEIVGKKSGPRDWRWRVVGGVGALCSVGVAAATLCIFIFGGRQLQKHQHQNQKLQFQVYTDEKRIKQVMQQATRLNHAILAVRGAPMNAAHISFGGYYDGL